MSPANETDFSNLPLRQIPGNYGLPFIGAIKDRLDYYYNQGPNEFFKTRVDKYKSTIFRTNMPPGPFMAPNPKVVAVLDAVSFPILFDTSKVEKRNILDGTYMPSTKLFGGYRVCAFLDPSEPTHAAAKQFALSFVASRHNSVIPIFRSCMSDLLRELEDDVDSGKVPENNFNTHSDKMSFDFVVRFFSDEDIPSKQTNLGSDGSKLFDKWLLFQLSPLMTLGKKFIPNFIEDLLLHTFMLPPILVKSDYQKLYDQFYSSAKRVLDDGERLGLSREEACHNHIFVAGFNSYGGMKILFPSLIKWVGLAGEDLHRRLADEIRTIVKSENGVSFSALEKMNLTKSVVYEALRIEPPVPFQYATAKEDIMIHSHDGRFEIKKGEIIFGYQPFATKDPKIFVNPEEFVGDRFMGDEGEKLLKYVYWSNGRETEEPTAGNKQCAGKNLVVLLSRLMLVDFFLRYDTFTVDVSTILLGPAVKLKTLTKSTWR
ncbi:allene oxide synthase 3-like [Impatiens glandulifera]|uniref:allene oxide synthase 3-like n=1 Tax=Impatiens glandulifera TaxID=253017 RepID=UPI001FB148F7|nr:allene oxide synthase 3-like [Impatiens glandulifera]